MRGIAPDVLNVVGYEILTEDSQRRRRRRKKVVL